jgi:hypothetical protein
MYKDHFQKSSIAFTSLRSCHANTTDFLNKGSYKLKQKIFGKGRKHYDFDINSQ